MGVEVWQLFYGVLHMLGTVGKSECILPVFLIAAEAGIFKKTLEDIEAR